VSTRQAKREGKDRLSLLGLVRSDVRRYFDDPDYGLLDVIRMCYTEESLVFLISFRIAQRVEQIGIRPLRFLIRLFHLYTTHKALSLLLGMRVHTHARIGEGLMLAHRGCIYIGPCEIGRNCNISQETTIGQGRLGTERFGVPKIGDNVYIAPGAKVFGKITIGNNVSIGANAVVSKDIPDNAIVVGNPGRVIGYQDTNRQTGNTLEEVASRSEAGK
jgi:serine O-acetyltransferase